MPLTHGRPPLTETSSCTRVSLSPNREYRWFIDGADPQRVTRESTEFQANSQTGLGCLMTRLRGLAEGRPINDSEP